MVTGKKVYKNRMIRIIFQRFPLNEKKQAALIQTTLDQL
jgi:hypothetical protein